uniref:Uncharacterized protein n=1 Tax=Medicago truncatula TaxID=3880 RepID=A2Q4R0_MEDTR|nr:hypothetical protein MtrDRAFT_AC157507g21v2 [Medicago truncatula]
MASVRGRGRDGGTTATTGLGLKSRSPDNYNDGEERGPTRGSNSDEAEKEEREREAAEMLIGRKMENVNVNYSIIK